MELGRETWRRRVWEREKPGRDLVERPELELGRETEKIGENKLCKNQVTTTIKYKHTLGDNSRGVVSLVV